MSSAQTHTGATYNADLSTGFELESEDAESWPEPAGLAERCSALPRWVVVANCVAVSVLIWWLALNLSGETSNRFPVGGVADFALASLLLAVTVLASLLAIRLHSVGSLTADRGGDRNRVSGTDAHTPVDPRTGLATRQHVEQRVVETLDAADWDTPPAVLLCEVRRLGAIRDSLGYLAGDEALQLVGRRVESAVAEKGFIGRLEASVLAVVLERCRSDRDAKLVAQTLLDCLAEPLTLSSGHVVSVSGVIGYVSGAEGEDAGQLLSNARSALGEAGRNARRSIAAFDPSAKAAAVARIELEQDLRGALERQELDVHYQPVVDVVRGVADRFEALVRWHHPKRGMVHPAEFLSVAAESELMLDIGEFVLLQAGRQAVQWSVLSNKPVVVSVNIGREQLVGGNLAQGLAVILDQIGLPPSQLEIEFAERVLEGDLDETLLSLQQLNMAGVKLAVDDFGTSQASLVRLQSLSMVSTLKMDRVFVEGVDSGSIDRRIVEAIVHLADSIGMAVVAEGVETAAQASALGELGVRLQQGFYHRRPGPAEDMADLVSGVIDRSDSVTR